MTAHELIHELIQSWNEKNPERFGALFKEDAHFIDVVGNTMVGRAQIAEGHKRPWSTVLKHAQLTADKVELRALTPEVSAAELRWTTTGHRSPKGDELPARHGAMLVVLVQDDELKIAQVCNSDFTSTYRAGDDAPKP